MIIINHDCGRLGNSIFRALANIVFLIIYDTNGHISNSYVNYDMVINDDFFVDWSTKILSGSIPNIKKDSVLYFNGFFQHDKIYIKYKNEIIQYIKGHSELKLKTHFNDVYNFIDLLSDKERLYYDIVVHLRLEDFIDIGLVMNPVSVKSIIDQILINKKTNNICFVLNKPKTDLEKKYLRYLLMNYNNSIIESNDIITDFHIMKNAKTLVCSCSTLSWAAAFFSNKIEYLYLPDYDNKRIHETFKCPIPNTLLYKYEQCDIILLNNILDEMIAKSLIYDNNNQKFKNVSFSITDSKNRSLDLKLNDIFNKSNGFFIELGAVDGLEQSNTAFFEFTKNWKGILIEPSESAYEKCIINRPNSHVVNYCCVDDCYYSNKISGDFNSVTMSSVNGKRLNNDNLIEVKSIQLEKILDTYFSCHNIVEIDFLSLDVEGYEYNVLKGLNLKKYMPKYILIEIYMCDYENILNYMNENGYILHSNFSDYNKIDNPFWDGTHNDYLFMSKII